MEKKKEDKSNEIGAPVGYGNRQVIAHDDPESLSTAKGWARYQELARAVPTPPDVPNGVLWLASNVEDSERAVKSPRSREIIIECGRHYDALQVAMTLFPSFEVKMTSFTRDLPTTFLEFVQVRWEGSAAGLPNLRKQVRVMRHPKGGGGLRECAPACKWTDLTDFEWPKPKAKREAPAPPPTDPDLTSHAEMADGMGFTETQVDESHEQIRG